MIIDYNTQKFILEYAQYKINNGTSKYEVIENIKKVLEDDELSFISIEALINDNFSNNIFRNR